MSAKQFKKLRMDKGYTQAELAGILKVTIRAISRWENGDRSVPHIAILALEGLKKKRKAGKR
jgi:transcriptional regulator with XRE-family HTH domain